MTSFLTILTPTKNSLARAGFELTPQIFLTTALPVELCIEHRIGGESYPIEGWRKSKRVCVTRNLVTKTTLTSTSQRVPCQRVPSTLYLQSLKQCRSEIYAISHYSCKHTDIFYRYKYAQHHYCGKKTNYGFAFNEGWAEYWAGSCRGIYN